MAMKFNFMLSETSFRRNRLESNGLLKVFNLLDEAKNQIVNHQDACQYG